MVDTFLKQYFWVFHLFVLAVVAFLTAGTVNAFVGDRLTPSAAEIAEARPQAKKTRSKQVDRGNTRPFLERNIFKAIREDIVPASESESPAAAAEAGIFDPKNCQPSDMRANLLATFVATGTGDSVAVLQDTSTKDTHAIREGEKYLEEAEVVLVDWREVTLRRNGRCEILSLEEQKAVVSDKPTPVETRPRPTGKKPKHDFGKNVKKVSENSFEIPKGDVDEVLSNLNALATQARIVPSFSNGKSDGFKLFSIRPGSLYAKIGIKNGDVIQRINGFDMNSPEKALEIYGKLKDANNISVDLKRRGKSQTLSYRIR